MAKYHATYEEGNPEVITYRRWSPCEGIWVEIPEPQQIPAMGFVSALIDAAVESGHIALDLGGMIPIIGEPLDVINGIWYTAEGNYTEAAFSFAGTTPVVGVVSTGAKYTFRIVIKGVGGAADKIVESSKYIIRYVDENGVSRLLKVGPPNGAQTELVGEWLGTQTYFLGFTPDQAKRIANWLFNSDINLIKMVGENEELLTVWKNLDEAGANSEQVNRLFSRLTRDDAASLLDFFKNNPGKVDGWKLLADTYSSNGNNRLWDKGLISKVSGLLSNSNFMSRIADGSTDVLEQQGALRKIIQKNYKAPCKACMPPLNINNAHLKYIDEYLDDVQYFVETFYGATPVMGADEIVNLMKSGAEYQIDAIGQTIRYLKERPNLSVEAFEPRLANVTAEAGDVQINNIGDILINLSGGAQLFIETKSWKRITLSNIVSSQQFFNQFRAYLNNGAVNAIDENLSYSFDKLKLLKDNFEGLSGYNPSDYFNNEADAVLWIKQRFQQMLDQKAGDLFNFLGESKFQQLFGVNNVSDFLDDVVSDLDNQIYAFIKVE